MEIAMNRRRFFTLAAATAISPASIRIADALAPSGPANASLIFPASQWEAASPRDLGWSLPALARAYELFASFPPASLFIVDRGRTVISWGDSARRIKLSSIRKSLLSVLFGKLVEQKLVDLNATLQSLGIDDDPPLTEGEKSATVRMLLQAKSGVYHSYVGGTPYMRERMPPRGSHSPGSFWSYNNGDFNALGGVYELVAKKTIGEAFAEEIAAPLQMQDFRIEDMYYLKAAKDAEEFAKSQFPAYHFRLTARDMARFGYLILQGGNWNGSRVISPTWIGESTTSYSQTNGFGDGFGYGYLWWINGYDLSEPVISARGALGKYIIILPNRDLVVAFANHTEFPEGPDAASAAEIKKLPDVPIPDMSKLLSLLVAARGS